MKRLANLKRLGFFTRLLDEAPPADRYRFAAEQIVRAETAGLDSAWIAQHHFHEREGAVKTASVWQVRERLHSRSSGRWRNYEAALTQALGNAFGG